ncbi:MAG: HEAT repeat domain-containing protein [bacterium]
MTDNTEQSDEPSQSENPDLEVPDTEEALDEDDLELDEWWSWGNFARLFIFPLIIVAVAVLIWGTVQFLIRDTRTLNDHISQIRNGAENQRWRAAYSLAQEVKRQQLEKKLTRSSALEIIDLYRTAKDPRIRKYLALVLAEVPIDRTLNVLKKGLKSSDPGVKTNTILALGRLHENATNDAFKTRVRRLAPRIAEVLTHDSSKVRRIAAFVLGSLNNKSVIDDLRTTLNDETPDVRWNGAIALGQLGSDAGEDELISVLKDSLRKRFQKKKQMDPSLRRNLLTNVIQALGKLKSRRALPLLKKIKENDRDSKVRKSALEAINNIQQS